MPRTILDNRSTQIRNFSFWVRGMLAEKKARQQDLADYLNLPQQSLSQRILGKTEWKLGEMADCCEFFEESYVIGAGK